MTGVTLTEFLLARIAEDEATAHAAIYADRVGQWRVSMDSQDDRVLVLDSSGFQMLRAIQEPATADHAARHDPARVLAEVEAKRRIVEMHRDWPVLAATEPQFEAVDETPDRVAFRMAQQIEWLTAREYVRRFGDEPPTAPILALLALPYADHPDYREEWKP